MGVVEAVAGVRIEHSEKWIRAYLGGEAIVDSRRVLLVWERPPYPAYYIPLADVRGQSLVPTTTVTHSESRGEARHFTVKAGALEAVDAAWQYAESPMEAIRDHVRFDWQAMDGWYEEDEQVFVHPRDPYTRVDILPSSRHVRVELDGVVLAESDRPTLLFETGLPIRYYLPAADVRTEVLVPSDTVSQCPYKGTASYWSAHVGALVPDLAWSYPEPLPESARIAGLIAFYNDRVDLIVDGEHAHAPVSMTTP